MKEAYITVPINHIQTNPYQPRQNFDPETLKELAQSIRENGVIQPLIVRPSAIIGYELMAGERRLRASQLAGLTEVPVIVKELTDQEMMTQAIIENLQRRDLSPIEEAQAYQNLIEKGNTHDAIAQVMGKSRPYISNTVRLLNLSEEVRFALEARQISQGHARALLAIAEREKQVLWLEQIIDQEMSVRQLEKALNEQPKKKEGGRKDVFIQEEEVLLSKAIGSPVTISHNKKGEGQIKISFSSFEEFERIIHNFK